MEGIIMAESQLKWLYSSALQNNNNNKKSCSGLYLIDIDNVGIKLFYYIIE